MDEWDVDEDLVDEYAAMPAETMPPIVYDSVKRTIIDGIHRANAAHKRGDGVIKAYVGRKEYLANKKSIKPG